MTSLLSTAKRAYLQTLAFPPTVFSSPNSTQTAIIKPYDGPDAQSVIQTVNARQHSSNGRGHNVRNSVSHGRGISVSTSFRNNRDSSAAASPVVNGNASITEPNQRISPRDRDQPSPTLPDIPSHPTLNSLISSSLGVDPTASDPAVLAAQPEHGAPRIGDPGKRMVGAALGIRHPGLPPRVINGPSTHGIGDVTRAMSGLVVAE